MNDKCDLNLMTNDELDREVAEALGWTYVPESHGNVAGLGPLPRFAHFRLPTGVERYDFSPSRRWDSAMEALQTYVAEQGRWEMLRAYYTYQDGSGLPWFQCLIKCRGYESGNQQIPLGNPLHCICQAILNHYEDRKNHEI